MASAEGTTEQQHEQGDANTQFFTNENGCKIFCNSWVPTDTTKIRALVFIVHGVAEHCMLYEPVAELLKEKNFLVFSHDHQGHGRSEGSKVQINDFRHYTRDLFHHIEMRKKDHPNLPVYLVAHSMGGGIALIATLDRPEYFAGLVLIASIITPDQEVVGPVKVFVGKILARVVPSFPIIPIVHEHKTRDKAMIEKYKADPLIYQGSVKARLSLCILNCVTEIEKKMATIKTPMLIMHGSADKIVSPKGAEALYKEAASSDKTLKMYADAYHQLHYEIEPVVTEARADIVQWLDERAPRS